MIYYHCSPEANITKFSGRYSPKFGQKGIFVCPKFNSILEDWAPWVAHKKHKKSVEKYDSHYSNLTIYTLEIPKEIINECQKLHDQKYFEAFDRYEKSKKSSKFMYSDFYGAWCWGPELFVYEKYLNQIKIISHEKFNYWKLISRPTNTFKREENNSIYGLAKKALPNYAAKKYIEIYSNIPIYLFEMLNFHLLKSRSPMNDLNKLYNYFIITDKNNLKYRANKNKILSKNDLLEIENICSSVKNDIAILDKLYSSIDDKIFFKYHKYRFDSKQMSPCQNLDYSKSLVCKLETLSKDYKKIICPGCSKEFKIKPIKGIYGF